MTIPGEGVSATTTPGASVPYIVVPGPAEPGNTVFTPPPITYPGDPGPVFLYPG